MGWKLAGVGEPVLPCAAWSRTWCLSAVELSKKEKSWGFLSSRCFCRRTSAGLCARSPAVHALSNDHCSALETRRFSGCNDGWEGFN